MSQEKELTAAIQYIVQGRNHFFGSKAKTKALSKAEYKEKPTHTICVSGLEAAFGNAVWQNLPFSNEGEICKILEEFRKKELPFFWWEAPITKIQNVQNPNHLSLTPILTQNGLQSGGLLTGISLQLDEAHHVPLLSDVAIRQVQTSQELKTFCQLIFSIYGLETKVIEQAYALIDRSTQASQEIHYLAYQDEKPIGGITLALGPSAAGLWNFATLSSVRKQGVGSALIQTAIQEIQRRSYQNLMAILMPGEMTKLWSQFNFKEICHFPFYISTNNFKHSAHAVPKNILNQNLL